MPRGEGPVPSPPPARASPHFDDGWTNAMPQQIKVYYKGDTNDFVVIVESPEAVTRYRKDSSIPLVDVVNSFDIFVTNKHGAQGVMDRASKSQLENEFNTYPPILGPIFADS